MNATDRSNTKFERRHQNRNFIYFTEHETNSEQSKMQRFIVPWQMVETKEGKYVVE